MIISRPVLQAQDPVFQTRARQGTVNYELFGGIVGDVSVEPYPPGGRRSESFKPTYRPAPDHPWRIRIVITGNTRLQLGPFLMGQNRTFLMEAWGRPEKKAF
jgi:hypothetical protein